MLATMVDYDPHVHRVEYLKHPTNNLETLLHLIKGCLGTGLLAMPEGFKYSGMIFGIVFFIFIALFATYCIHVLVGSQYILCKKKKVGLLLYGDSIEYACEVGPSCFRKYRKIGSLLSNIFLISYQTGACCIYWVFVGTSLKYVFDVYTPEKYELYVYMLLMFIPHCLIMCVRNLKLFAPFSLVADIVSLVTFGVVFYYIFEHLDSSFDERDKIGRNVQDYPLFLGTVLFSLQSLPICISVENNMESPEHFLKPFGVLNIGFAILSFFYLFVGIFGYWRYGDDIHSSITLNFPPEDILAEVIILSYCLCIYVSYGLNAYVPITIIYDEYLEPRLGEDASKLKKLVVEMFLRLLFVIATCTFSVTIPLLGLIISFCGSVCLSALGLIFPAFLEMCAYWEEGKSKPKTLCFWKEMAMIFIGLVGMSSGLYSTLRSMYEKLSSGNY
ncbi:proton-coupled amino acid transporter-like protein CG1139 isoform X1 [Euwallacea fornicatus]|uniref:proton-coupled amino acid transporter-like protein CG1139 isoform X1 n=1 Tax=Euwallacea fornicatus TaxID=995702 RepID=UPI00338E214F